MSDHLNSSQPRSILRWLIALPVVVAGVIVFADGVYLETRNPRTNDQDNIALCVLAVGASITGAGISIPFARPLAVFLVALASPFVVYSLVLLLIWVVLPLIGIFRMVIGI